MPTIVSIKSSARAVVISERIDDRERFENGRDVLLPNEEQHFVIHPGQSLRVVEAEPEMIPVAEAAEQSTEQADEVTK